MRKYFASILPFIFVFVLFVGCSSDALEFDQLSTVIREDEARYILLEPSDVEPITCFLFYPGGLVEPEAYVSVLQGIAEKGYRVVLLKATADLAIFNVNRASKVVEDFPEIEHWIIGGHSLGGVVAIKAIVKDPDDYNGLVLMAAYPAGKDDLSGWNGSVLSLSAENDGLTSAADIENSKLLLPETIELKSMADFPTNKLSGKSIFFDIEGGNHAQFGNYGLQKDDGQASISKEDQQNQVIQLIKLFFDGNGW